MFWPLVLSEEQNVTRAVATAVRLVFMRHDDDDDDDDYDDDDVDDDDDDDILYL